MADQVTLMVQGIVVMGELEEKTTLEEALERPTLELRQVKIGEQWLEHLTVLTEHVGAYAVLPENPLTLARRFVKDWL